MEAVFECASGRLLLFGQYESSSNAMLRTGEIEFRGTLGTAYIGKSIEVVPEKGGQFQKKTPKIEPIKIAGQDGDLTVQHARNFLDCMVSREKPKADVEIGHRSTSFSLLANIALQTRSRLEWDAQAERITNHPTANDLLDYEYREPWRSVQTG
jgi:hypothetical protein